jgi:hypothetical protein
MYKAGGEQGGAANGAQDANAASSNGEATDVDFEEVKENK